MCTHGQPALTHGGRARDGGTSMYTYSRANPVPAPPPRLPPAAASPHCSFLASASAAASGFSSLYLSSGESSPTTTRPRACNETPTTHRRPRAGGSSPRTAAVSSDERMQAGTCRGEEAKCGVRGGRRGGGAMVHQVAATRQARVGRGGGGLAVGRRRVGGGWRWVGAPGTAAQAAPSRRSASRRR